MRIDVNSDLREGFGLRKLGDKEAILASVKSYADLLVSTTQCLTNE